MCGGGGRIIEEVEKIITNLAGSWDCKSIPVAGVTD